jgi:hypothetical protein
MKDFEVHGNLNYYLLIFYYSKSQYFSIFAS